MTAPAATTATAPRPMGGASTTAPAVAASAPGPAIPLPSFDHVLAMCDEIGMFEHADHAEPRPSHGYCTDDAARLLVVVARQPKPSAEIVRLGTLALRFLAGAQGAAGHVRNRRGPDGRWHGRRGVEDCWGRSLWAFGTVVRRGPTDQARQSALAYFNHSVELRSPWPRAMAFAALGAAEVLETDARHTAARKLLADAVTAIGAPSADPDWPWPERRLSYANAVLPEALLAAGHGLGRADLVADGLRLLGWLLERETVDGHLSPTPVGGAGPGDGGPRFDQQPIEVAAMADACARAATLTGDESWAHGVELAVRWFAGRNDAHAVMWDPVTGGGYDGLEPTGPNLNQGAESTLALISTLQVGRRLVPASG
jgi:hypothetical protein